MKTPILRALAIVGIACGCFTPAFGQVASVEARNVPQKNIEEFLRRETTYWSEVARHAIKAGKMDGWELWRRVDGMDLAGKPNFVFVNIFAKWADLNNAAEIWDPAKVFPGVDLATIETWSMGTVTDHLFYQGYEAITKAPRKYVRVNFAKTSDVRRYIELEQTVWKPFIQEQMNANKTNIVSWGLSRLVLPGGTDRPFDAVTIDGFATLGDALSPEYGTAPDTPAFAELWKIHQKTSIELYVLIKAVYREK